MAIAPVNHRKQDAAPAAVAAAADYAIQVADNYVKWFEGANGPARDPLQPLKGLRILEIGAGEALGSTVLLACAGAQMTSADRFVPTWDPEFHGTFFAELLRKVEGRGPQFCLPIERVLDAGGFDAAVDLHALAAEELAQSRGTFDVVYSNAVLEHVQDLTETAENLAAVTAAGGYNFHQVDFRYHPSFDRPLEHLTIPLPEFLQIRANCHCECGSRWRASDVAAEFERAGFAVTTVANMLASAEYLADVRPRLQPEFVDRPDSDLAAISAFFSMRRRAQ